jgi:SAM-dependent methyltransferase
MHEMSDWERFHDLEAAIYDDLEYTKNAAQEVDFLTDELGLPPGASVLDVGCGTGRHSIELARRGYRVTGIDISEGMLSRAREKADAEGLEVRWIRGDACDFTFEDKFDAALCLCEGAFGLLSGTADAIEQPLAILRNVRDALKPGGKTLFTVLNGLAQIRRQRPEDVEQGRFDPRTLTNVALAAPRPGLAEMELRERAFVPTELVLLFRTAGLRVLNVWGGTAGNWGKRPIDLDEMEIMVVAEKEC